jgi:outer membrane protein OmpA-like peptidoglycan-associated protein
MKLSQARADAVRNYMIGAAIPASRIGGAPGYGKARPVADNDTDAGRARSRRVEIVIDDSEGANGVR